jgi:hypothetical protein
VRPRAPDATLLSALLHDAERVIDHQVRAMEELDDKSEHMLGLGVGALAGGLGLATVAAGKESLQPDWLFFWSVVAGGLLNMAAILAFLESYLGIRDGGSLWVGPSLDWVREKSVDPTWSLASHRLSLLSADGYASYYRFNRERQQRSARWRARGLAGLALATVCYTVALVQILAQAIEGVG